MSENLLERAADVVLQIANVQLNNSCRYSDCKRSIGEEF